MKKKHIVVLILVAILVIIALFIKGKIHNEKVEYKIAEIEEYKYLKYRNKDSFGIIDRDGKIIIEATYKKIDVPNPEKDIFICYKDEETSEVLNSKKEKLFEEYDQIEPIKLKNVASTLCFEKSALKYKKDGKYGIIDFNGKQIVKNEYQSIENLQSTEGKFLVNKNDKYGVVNLNGLTLVRTEYDKIETDEYYGKEVNYKEEGFIVSNTTNEGYRYGYIDYKGNKVLNTEFNQIIRIDNKNDIYFIVSKNGKYGLYKGKKQIIKPEYQSIINTDNGALIIEKNKQFGIANFEGKIKVQAKYSEIVEDGLYLYAKSSTGNDVYTPEGDKKDISFSKTIYETENDNYRITAIVNNDIMYYGIENKQGTSLVDNIYSNMEYAYGDYFIVENKEEKYGIIDANGKIILETKYDLIQKIKDKNIIQILSRKNNNIKIYSSKMEKKVDMKAATIQNNTNYVKIVSKDETVYLDKDGNKIDEKSDIVKNELKKKLPDKIGNYKKQQNTLDDAYYEKVEKK